MRLSLRIPLFFLSLLLVSCGAFENMEIPDDSEGYNFRAVVVCKESPQSCASTVAPNDSLLFFIESTPVNGTRFLRSIVWNFADTHGSELDSVTHVFRQGGIYPVILRVEDRERNIFRDTIRTFVNTPPRIDSLLFPRQGEKGVAFEGTSFIWFLSDPDPGDSLRIVFQLSTDSSFSDSSVLHDKNSLTLSENLEKGQLYYWRIQAEDRFGARDSSEIRNFRTKISSDGSSEIQGVLFSPLSQTSPLSVSVDLKLSCNTEKNRDSLSISPGFYSWKNLQGGHCFLWAKGSRELDSDTLEFDLPPGIVVQLDTLRIGDRTAPQILSIGIDGESVSLPVQYDILGGTVNVPQQTSIANARPRFALVIRESDSGLDTAFLKDSAAIVLESGDTVLVLGADSLEFHGDTLSFVPDSALPARNWNCRFPLRDLAGNQISSFTQFLLLVNTFRVDLQLPDFHRSGNTLLVKAHTDLAPDNIATWLLDLGNDGVVENSATKNGTGGIEFQALVNGTGILDIQVTLNSKDGKSVSDTASVLLDSTPVTPELLYPKEGDTLIPGDLFRWSRTVTENHPRAGYHLYWVCSPLNDTSEISLFAGGDTVMSADVLAESDSYQSCSWMAQGVDSLGPGDISTEARFTLAPAYMRNLRPLPPGLYASNIFSGWQGDTAQVLSGVWMDRFEVRQTEYEKLMQKNPSPTYGLDLPVQGVTWYDAIRFANVRSRNYNLDTVYTYQLCPGCSPSGSDTLTSLIWQGGAKGFRLPTEDEWEYAARSGIQAAYGTLSQNPICNIDIACDGQLHTPGTFSANPWEFFDLYGNVREWTWDTWSSPDPRWNGRIDYRNETPSHSAALRTIRSLPASNMTRTALEAYNSSLDQGLRLVLQGGP